MLTSGLDDAAVFVCTAPVGASDGAYEAWLDDAERARRDRFLHESDRTAYALAHALLHSALLRVAGVPLHLQAVDSATPNRPRLRAIAGAAAPPHFSLSHAHSLVAVALARRPGVGVDAECSGGRRIDSLALARRVFAPAEADWVAGAVDVPARNERFLRLWTLKEALLKAIGEGLAVPLDAFELQADPPRLLAGHAVLPARGRWHLRQWQPMARTWVALALDDDEARPLAVTTVHLEGETLQAWLRPCPPDRRG